MKRADDNSIQGFFDALLENSRDSILILDPEYRIVAFNSHADSGMIYFYGRSLEKGKTFWDYVDRKENQSFEKNFHRALKGKRISAERKLKSPADRDIWIETSFSPVANQAGKVTHVLYSYVNITSDKNRDEQLLSNQNILRSIYNSNIHRLCIVDRDGRLAYFNKASGDYVKKAYNQKLSVGDHLMDYIPDDIRSRFQNSLGIAMSSGTVSIEFDDDDYYNEEHYYEAHFDPVKTEEGKVELVAIWIRDITDQKHAEQAVIESEANLKAIFNNSSQTFYLIDKNFKILAFNQAAQDMIKIQYGREMKVGQSIEEYTLPENHQSEFQEIKKAFSGKPMVIEKHVIGSNYEFWFERHYNCLRNADGEVDRITIWSVDITERKKAEEALKNNEKKFRALTSLSPVGIYQQDKHGHNIYVNDRLSEIYGMDMVDTLSGKWKINIHPDDKEEYESLKRKAVAFQEHFFLEYRIVIDNNITHVIEHALPLKDNLDEFIGYIGTVMDISIHKQNEQVLEEKRHIERSLKFKSEFLASMSHEIRTPLNGILSMTELLLQSELNEEQKEYAEMVFSSSKTLRSIVNDILDLSKLEAGKVSVNTSNFNLRYFMKEIESVYKRMAQEKKLSFDINYSKNLPEVIETDRRRLMQVLTNLLRNALKFTDRGGIIVNLDYVDRKNKNYLRLDIEDTGIGIGQQDLEHLFKDYYQVSKSLREELEGTGLGLSISKKLVHLLGGKIGVNSEEGKGSTFWFEVPVKKVDTLQQEVKVVASISSSKPTLRVLLVEDNLINQKAFSVMLKKMGCSVEMASNGIEAIEKYADDKFDIIFMDIQMPEMNGLEATEIIKKHKKAPPIIGLSGNIFHGDNSSPEGNIMDDFVMKPVVSQDLQIKLNKWASKQA